MKRIIGYLKVFILVFIAIVVLYYMEFLFHSKLHHIIALKLKSMSSHWYFYEGLFFTVFDFFFALIGILFVKYYKRLKHYSEDLLFIFSIPALFPIFLMGLGIISGIFLKACFTPQYFAYENIIIWFTQVFFWIYAIIFLIYVLLKMSKRYALVFLLEYFIFLAYLSAFYLKLIGPIRLPFNIYF
jgi:hypothetical protein